jgi:hypothetical protein
MWATILAETQAQMDQLSTRFHSYNFKENYTWFQISIALLTFVAACTYVLFNNPEVIGTILNVSHMIATPQLNTTVLILWFLFSPFFTTAIS